MKIMQRSTVTLFAKITIWGLLGVLAIYYTVVYAQACKGHLPFWNDEEAYFANARLTSETGALDAAILFDNYTSRIGRFDAHGFAYSLLNGIAGKILGFSDRTLVTQQMLYLALCLAVLLAAGIPRHWAAAAMSAVLLYFVCILYTFTDMQEIVHILFAVCTGAILYRLAANHEEDRRRRYWGASFLVLMTLASLFRPLWMISAVALIPLAKGWRERLAVILLTIIGMMGSYAYMKYYVAPYPAGFMFRLNQRLAAGGLRAGLDAIWSNLKLNIFRYAFGVSSAEARAPGGGGFVQTIRPFFISPLNQTINYYFLSKILYLGATTWAIAHGIKKRDGLTFGVGLAGLGTLAALFLLYDMTSYREHRTIAAIFILSVVVLMARRIKPAAAVFILALLVMFPAANRQSQAFMIQRQQACAARASRGAYAQQVEELAGRMPTKNKKLLKVLVLGLFPDQGCRYVLTTRLPVRTSEGRPVQYLMNWGRNDYANLIQWQGPIADYILYLKQNPSAHLPPVARARLLWQNSAWALYTLQP